jgi:hypothetical protein
VLYVYAIVDQVPGALGLGLDEVELRAVAGDRLAAVVGEHRRSPTLGDDQLCAYEALLERLGAAATVLPLRFGTTVGGEPELRNWLRTHEGEFLELLETVRGAVELSVRAELAAGSDTRVSVHRRLAGLARRAILFDPGPGSGRLRASYLVEDGEVEAFGAAVDRLGRELGIEIGCNGPWPPFSFVAEVGRRPSP